MLRRNDQDTICALSTAEGAGGIAVIRVSGRAALKIGRSLGGFLPLEPESHKIYFGQLRSLESEELIDEVLISYFATGRSFTGEQTLEISCHGGTILSQRIINELINGGCRMAERGEFTYRAFMNDRIDLVQAESVLNLIEAKSQGAARLAIRQLEGSLSAKLKEVESELVSVLAHLEANIDFAAEDIVVASSAELLKRTENIRAAIGSMTQSYNKGRLLKQGLRVALIGEPNVGKSSLLNWLLGQDRAIVTNKPGTTRDVVEGTIQIHGTPVTFLDTAGVRVADSEVEALGIEKSKQAAAESDLVFFVVDSSKSISSYEREVLAEIPAEKRVILANKIDMGSLTDSNLEIAAPILKVSALEGVGLGPINELIGRHVKSSYSEDGSTILQARQYELLEKARKSLDEGFRLLENSESPEFIIFEIQNALYAVHEILGIRFDDQVMDRVFNEFCLGK